jgi:hypothetical protein
MADTEKQKDQVATPEPAEPKTFVIQIDAEVFTNADYEIMEDWASGNAGKHSTKEIFDILDRVVVGGFRKRKFIEIKPTVKSILQQLTSAAVGPDLKN